AAKEGLGPRGSEKKWRAPERARDQRDRDLGRGPARGSRKSRPCEDQQGQGDRREAHRERRDHLKFLPAGVELLKVHQEDGEAVWRGHGVLERRRAWRIDGRGGAQGWPRQGWNSRRERKNRYREKAAHLFTGYGPRLRPD